MFAAVVVVIVIIVIVIHHHHETMMVNVVIIKSKVYCKYHSILGGNSAVLSSRATTKAHTPSPQMDASVLHIIDESISTRGLTQPKQLDWHVLFKFPPKNPDRFDIQWHKKSWGGDTLHSMSIKARRSWWKWGRRPEAVNSHLGFFSNTGRFVFFFPKRRSWGPSSLKVPSEPWMDTNGTREESCI